MTIARRINTDRVHHGKIRNYSTCTCLVIVKYMVFTVGRIFYMSIDAQRQWTLQVELNLLPSKERLGSHNLIVICMHVHVNIGSFSAKCFQDWEAGLVSGWYND